MAIKVPILSEWNPKGVKRAMADFKKLETSTQKAGFALKKALVPATAALAGLTAAAGASLKAAADDAKQQAELARQLEASTGATEAQIAANEEFIATMELATATSDAVLRPALGNLVRATGDVTDAQQLLGTALDISAATGKDLNTVSEALSKAYQGETSSLKRLDPSLTAVIASGAEFNEIGQALADTFGGAAAEAADTTAGRFERMKIQMDNAQEAIGYALLPILEALVPVLESVATWVGENTELFIAIGGAIAIFSGAIIAANIAMKVWSTITAITTALNTALAASFTALQVASGLIIFTALVAVFIALQKRFKIIQKLAKALSIVFNVLKAAVEAFVNFLIDGINTLIDFANKLPFVEIDKITWRMGEAADAAEDLADAATHSVQPLTAMKDIVAASRDAFERASGAYETATELMDELAPSADAVADAIDAQKKAMEKTKTANEEFEASLRDTLDAVFGLNEEWEALLGNLDNEAAIRDVTAAFANVNTAIEEYGDNTAEAASATEDLWRQTSEAITQLGNIPESVQSQIMIDVMLMDEERVRSQLEYFAALSRVPLMSQEEFFQEFGNELGVSSSFAPATPVAPANPAAAAAMGGTPMVVNYYAPAGQDADEAINTLQRGGRRTGTLNVPVSGNIQQ